ncbi:MAG: MerR family DNA-binding protein [Thiohalorhabdus sp.]
MSGERTIGRLAAEAGVNVETVRYYQRRGLMPEPPKPRAGFRTYGEEAVARLRFIQRAQRLGFTLREVAELLALGDGACDEVRERAAAKRAEIQTRIRDLAAMEAELGELERRCHRGEQAGCALVAALSDPAE